MGAVHVTVQLSNATDIEMAEQGLLEKAKVRTCEVEAVVDTGATRSIIPQSVAERLGLRIWQRATGILADGSRASCGVSSAIRFKVDGRETIEDAYVMGDEVLIGQTVLESADLLVDCHNQKVIPNPKHPDGPAFRI